MAEHKAAGWSKTLIWVALVLVALAIAAVFFARRLSPELIAAVEAYGEAATGTEVTLREADVSLTDSRGTLSGLTVGNPEGYSTDYALQVDDIQLDVELGSLAGDALVLNEIVVDGATLNAEQQGSSSNLTEILERMQQDDADAAPAGEPAGRIIIDRFRLVDGRVTLTSELLDEQQYVDLPEVVVEDVGRAAGGVSYDEATQALLGPILTAARGAVQQRLQDAAAEAATDELEDAAEDKLRDLLEQE